MLLHTLHLQNILSFDDTSEPIPLRPLNVIIGPNGSGKSNFLEAVELLRCAPNQLVKSIRENGGVVDWLWKGSADTPPAALDAVFSYPNWKKSLLRYRLSFTAVQQRFQIVEECVEREYLLAASRRKSAPKYYYRFQGGHPVLDVRGVTRSLLDENIDLEHSILAQRRDPSQYPELTYLAEQMERIRLYREWTFGRRAAVRRPQKTDLPNSMLEPDGENLGLVLNRLRRTPSVKQRLLKELRALYAGIDDYDVAVEGGTVQVFFQEGRKNIPATRLSDGTLRYLCLLVILCDPQPPPLICIEEPELGLHPDVLPTLAELLKEASERCQLIVTTHSDVLVDAMTDQPESVMVCEKGEGGTTLNRLDAKRLRPWLEKYRLGQLWTRGEIGGNRW